MSKKIRIALYLLIVSLIVVPYILAGIDEKPITSEVRSQAPGKFAKLSDGQLHYLWVEPDKEIANGKTIVMSHGMYYPNFMFTQNAQAFADAGYRVLLFDHFGHGYSDRPDVDFTPAFFDREVTELIQYLAINQPFILIGQSMGGLIVTQFAANHPEKISELVLFVPAGLKMSGSDTSLGVMLLGVPFLRNWIWHVFARKSITRVQPPPCDICGKGKLLGDGLIQTKFKGYFESMLSILVNFNMRNQDHYYEKLANLNIPVFAIFGEQDTTVDIKSASRLQKAIPTAHIISLHEGDHALHIRHPEKINQLVLAELADE